MKKIITLKDRITQESIYPVTSISAVLDENGKSIENILTEKSEEINIIAQDAIQQAQVAEDSIITLTNLSNSATAQEELNSLKSQIETNKTDITLLKTEYNGLKDTISNVVKNNDITKNVKLGGNKIPTSEAVETYINDIASEIMDYVIDTTTVIPNYAPKNSGQVLVNMKNNIIYFSPGNSAIWYGIQATPIILPDSELEGTVSNSKLELEGSAYVEEDTLIIEGGELDNTVLVIPEGNGDTIINNEELEITNSTTTVNNGTLNLGNNSSISGSTLSL